MKRVTVLNMMDEAEKHGIQFDLNLFQTALGSPVIAVSTPNSKGIDTLLDSIVTHLSDTETVIPQLRYDSHLEAAIERVTDHLIRLHPHNLPSEQARWLSIKLLEGDEEARSAEIDHPELMDAITNECRELEHEHSEDPATMLASSRFALVHGLLLEARQHEDDPQDRYHRTRILDNIALHPVMGLPLLILVMWVMFETTFSLGAIPTGWIKSGVDLVTAWTDSMLPEGMFHDLVVNGVLAGVGGTIVFLPNIVILFFFMAMLSGTGYLSRASFLMDRILHNFGLHGSSLIPMVAGFGCNVPAVMASNIITNPRSRLISILVAPFMSCSARLPTFILFASAFFSHMAGTVVFAIYMTSILTAILSAVILDRLLPGSGQDYFALDLPPYRLPSLHSVLHHMWDSAQGFVTKVTSVILVGSIAIWFLQEFPKDITYSQDYDAAIAQAQDLPDSDQKQEQISALTLAKGQEKLEKSYMGMVSVAVTPVFRPLGFSWHESASIMTGFVAKEVVVATYAVIYAQEKGSNGLIQALRDAMPVSTALAFMIFTLLYAPCLSTIATIVKETGHWKWGVLSLAYSLVTAWVLALLVRGIASLLT